MITLSIQTFLTILIVVSYLSMIAWIGQALSPVFNDMNILSPSQHLSPETVRAIDRIGLLLCKLWGAGMTYVLVSMMILP